MTAANKFIKSTKNKICKIDKKHFTIKKIYAKIFSCVIYFHILALCKQAEGLKDHKEVRKHEQVRISISLSAKVEDEVRDAVVEKAKSYIARYNGNVTEVEEWGKKKLAYEIQKMHEGFYYFIQFEADAQCPAEVERHVRIMDNVLRYLVVRKDA